MLVKSDRSSFLGPEPCVRPDDYVKQVENFLKKLPKVQRFVPVEQAIRQYLKEDESIAHSQLVGRSWNMMDPRSVDDLVEFLEDVVRGVNAILEGGTPSGTRREDVSEMEVPEVRDDVHLCAPGFRSGLRQEQLA